MITSAKSRLALTVLAALITLGRPLHGADRATCRQHLDTLRKSAAEFNGLESQKAALLNEATVTNAVRERVCDMMQTQLGDLETNISLHPEQTGCINLGFGSPLSLAAYEQMLAKNQAIRSQYCLGK